MPRIAGYTYRAETYCANCIVGQLTANPGDVYHKEPRVWDNLDAHLDLLARIYGVADRYDEHTFDSDVFPKMILSTQIDEPETCGNCGTDIH